MRGVFTGCVFTDGAASTPYGLEAELAPGGLHVGGLGVPDDERPAVELPPGGLERLLGHVEGRVLEPVAERQQRRVGVVVDDEDRARPLDAPAGTVIVA